MLCTTFRRVTNLKLRFLPYSSRYFYLTFANSSKREQSDEIRTLLSLVTPHEAAWSKIHRYALHSPFKYKHLSWGKYEMPDFRLGNVFQLPSRRISRRWTRSGMNLVICLEALGAQTHLFWCEMMIKKMYLKCNTRQENFRTSEERDMGSSRNSWPRRKHLGVGLYFQEKASVSSHVYTSFY